MLFQIYIQNLLKSLCQAMNVRGHVCVLRSCICVLLVSILSLFLRFFYWGLDLFRRCDISFYMILY